MTLQSRLQGPEAAPARPRRSRRSPIRSPSSGGWSSSGRFHRDSGFGRIYHPGSVSLRENAPTDSLHIVIHGDHISAHVDRVSPLGARPDQPSRYSVTRAARTTSSAPPRTSCASSGAARATTGRTSTAQWMWEGHEHVPDRSHLLDPCAWSVHLEARVAGTLDETRCARPSTPCWATGRPSTTARRRRVRRRRRPSSGARMELLREPVAMSEWPPLRVRLVHRPGGDVLLLNVNHAAADGFSAVRVLQSIADAYAGTDEAGPPLDFLAANDLPVRPASAPVSAVEAWYRTAVERVRDLLANPARIAPEQPRRRAGLRLPLRPAVGGRHPAGGQRPPPGNGPQRPAGRPAPGHRRVEPRPRDARPADRRARARRPPPGGVAPRGGRQLLGDGPGVDQPPPPVGRPGRPQGHHRPEDPQQAVPHRRRPAGRPRPQRPAAAVGQAVAGRPPAPHPQPRGRHRHAGQRRLAGRGARRSAPRPARPPTSGSPSRPGRLTACASGPSSSPAALHLTFRYPRRLFGPDAAQRFAASYVEHILAVAERRW